MGIGQRAKIDRNLQLNFLSSLWFVFTSIQRMPKCRNADSARLLALAHIVHKRSLRPSHLSLRQTEKKSARKRKKKKQFRMLSDSWNWETKSVLLPLHFTEFTVRALSLTILSVHPFPNWLKLDLLEFYHRKFKWFLISDKTYGHRETYTFRHTCDRIDSDSV